MKKFKKKLVFMITGDEHLLFPFYRDRFFCKSMILFNLSLMMLNNIWKMVDIKTKANVKINKSLKLETNK
jgi:hypothetical protein